ncbi:MAG: hypothetical protein U0792_06455 [Gemmataceae bacterium]
MIGVQLHVYSPGLAIVIDCVIVGLVIAYRMSLEFAAGDVLVAVPRAVSDREPIHAKFDAWRKFDPNFSSTCSRFH